MQKSRLIAVALATGCIVLLGAGIWSLDTRSAQRSEAAPVNSAIVQVVNLTTALEVVSAQRDGKLVRVQLRNVSNKAVTAYAYSIGKLTVKNESVYYDNAIAPGAVREEKFNLPYPSSSDLSEPEPPIEILGAVLDDGTIDAKNTGGGKNLSVMQEMLDERIGHRMFMERVIPLLDQTLSGGNAYQPSAAGMLKSTVALHNVPSAPSGQLTRSVLVGMQRAKDKALRDLHKVESNLKDLTVQSSDPKFQRDLASMKQYYEQVVAKLRAVSKAQAQR